MSFFSLESLSLYQVRWSWRATILFHHFFFFLVQRFWISQIVFGILKHISYMSGTFRKSEIEFPWSFKWFSGLWNSFRKSQKVLGTFKHFLEVSKSCRKSQKILEASNSSRKYQTVLENLKQFPVVSMSCWGCKTVLQIFKKFSVLSESVCTAITRCARKIGTLSQNLQIKPLKKLNLLLKLQKTVGMQPI